MSGFRPRPFGCGVGSQCHHKPRFPRPPCDPGRSDFPSPVLTLAILRRPAHQRRGSSGSSHTPLPQVVCLRPRPRLGCDNHARLCVRKLSRCPGPPSTQGSFTRSGRYPERRGAPRHVSGHYPTFLATTNPCAGPKPSRRLRLPYTAGLRRLPLLPAGSWPFPTLSPRSFYRCLDPYPAVPLRCMCPFLPEGLRPHPTCQGFGTPHTRRCATSSTGKVFRGCSHSVMFRLPYSLGPPVAPTTRPLCAQGGRAVYVTQNPCGCPPWAVISLRA